MSPATARLFVALSPPPEVSTALEAMRRHITDGVRWTTPDQWHVTLRFLGTTEVEPAVLALEQLRGVPGVRGVLEPAVMRLGREVLALPVDGLTTLAAAVHRCFEGLGRPAERRPFRGHVTLARGRGVQTRWAGGLAGPLAWPADRVDLVRSDLRPTGARYETVAEARLGPAVV